MGPNKFTFNDELVVAWTGVGTQLNGIYNLELIDSRALVRDKAWEFMFVLGQPLYKGSTQVNINPVAIR
ncbi:hypothetical protein PS639_01807 [Pseudomonas fluorescens]|nr:hypothetical protein [Pseudomonas fluorescens]VVM71665.1 hypothetical protein PS639_01807 [Pseudomonas fluorescens]